ncbi:MAG: GNAT family N-acetyltransferase [Actinomycetota bacterium]|nr:GNAT family N-acetyltransferase [Actinomycetota bacterium]
MREAQLRDARQVAAVHVRAWQAAYRGLLSEELLDQLSVQERERRWHELLSETHGRSFTLVSVDDGERVEGFCALSTPSRDADADARTAELAATYVEPDRWRVGVGTALVDAALARLRRGGYEQVMLWVFAANDQARSFYRRFGFEPDGRVDQHDWSGGVVEVRLRVRL